MSPLLPHPLPWTPGDPLPWARARHWNGVPALGSVAIQPVPHRVDEESLPAGAGLERFLPREAIPDLLVRCEGSSLRPSWHGATGLYGFVGLPAGVHTFTIDDPRGRYLPARLQLLVRDRSAVIEDLRRLQPPAQADDWRQFVHRLTLRQAPGAVRRPGSTGLWGVVRDASGGPIPYALVQLQTCFHAVFTTATTWSDGSGGYVLHLDGERPDPLATPPDLIERDGRLCLPEPPAAREALPWSKRLPVLDQALVEAVANGVAPVGYGPPLRSGTDFRFRDGPSGPLLDRVPLHLGHQHRWDILLI